MGENMMKIFKMATLVAFLVASLGQANAQLSPERQQAKSELTKVYNAFLTMSDREYEKAMDSLIGAARDEGMYDQALVFEQLKDDPESRSEVLAMMNEQIETQSENGLFFGLYLLTPRAWCSFGDLYCAYAVGVLSILTLDGHPASQY